MGRCWRRSASGSRSGRGTGRFHDGPCCCGGWDGRPDTYGVRGPAYPCSSGPVHDGGGCGGRPTVARPAAGETGRAVDGPPDDGAGGPEAWAIWRKSASQAEAASAARDAS
ncbi:hypothetical protein GCM10020358_26950 [Amorphoplanes nipponensis]